MSETVKQCGWLAGALLAVWAGGCSKSSQPLDAEVFSADSCGGRTVHAVTFNIRYGTAPDGENRWENRRQMVIDLLREYQADVLGFQEALAFQTEQLQEGLPEYDVAAVGRDDGRKAGEACPIFYRRSRFERLDSGTFWFSETPDVPGSKHWGNELPRICTWVSLRDRRGGQVIWVFNVHLDHQSQVSRQKSVALLAERIGQWVPAGCFPIVMGDFNMELRNPAMEPLLSKEGLHLADCRQTAPPQEEPVGTWHDFGRQLQGAKIDHILIPACAKVIEAEVDRRQFDGRYPSDHFPLRAVFCLGAEPAQEGLKSENGGQ